MAEGEDEGRKQGDNSLKAVSVVGRLQENIRAALEDKNRSTSLSCPQSGSALICSKKGTDVSGNTLLLLLFFSCNDRM